VFNKISFLIFYLSITILIPFVFIFVAINSDSLEYWMLNYFSEDNVFPATIYAIISCLIIIYLTSTIKPINEDSLSFKRIENTYLRHKNFLFILAAIGLLGASFLNLLYGAADTNVVATRPLFATFFGYFLEAFILLFFCIIGFQIFLYGNLKNSGIILILLFFIMSTLAFQRSALFTVISIILIFSIFSPIRLQIATRNIIFFGTIGFISLLIGNSLRGSPTSELLFDLSVRLFQYNVVLFLALENFEKINQILLENQPAGMISNIFSFLGGKVYEPSSVRLPEFWGVSSLLVSSHLVGWSYGWLGLSYGLFKWWGLLFHVFFFGFVIKVMNFCLNKSNVYSLIIFTLFALTFFEYFGNFGLDSFVEKFVKRFIYIILILIIILFAKLKLFKKI